MNGASISRSLRLQRAARHQVGRKEKNAGRGSGSAVPGQMSGWQRKIPAPSMEVFLARNVPDFYGPCSSKPCLITRGYIIIFLWCSHDFPKFSYGFPLIFPFSWGFPIGLPKGISQVWALWGRIWGSKLCSPTSSWGYQNRMVEIINVAIYKL